MNEEISDLLDIRQTYGENQKIELAYLRGIIKGKKEAEDDLYKINKILKETNEILNRVNGDIKRQHQEGANGKS